MTEKVILQEESFKIVDQYLGFLGVIIALVMQFAWDVINKETTSESLRLLTEFHYAICLLLLWFILIYYTLRLKGSYKMAEAV